jgi:hypothetical protein
MSHTPATVHPVADMSNEQGERAVREEARRLAAEAALVIDPRLADLWPLIWAQADQAEEGDVPLGTLAALLRLAYAVGYTDALCEERAGALYAELGLSAPTSPSPSKNRPRRGRAASGNSDT